MMADTYLFPLLVPIAFLFGICMGSFVTMASYRIPLGKDIVFAPSHCTSCNVKLGVKALVPLFSWLVQGGKCRYCQAKISMRYPLIELCMGLVFVFIVLLCGLSFKALLLAVLATALAIMIVVDLEHYIIPDSIQVVVFFTGIVYRVYHGDGFEDIFPGIVAGLFIGLALHYGYIHLRKKDALGFGDVKFMAVTGCWLPLIDFVPFFLFSGIIGIFTGLLWRVLKRGELFPFGPALAVSLFINVLAPGLLQKLIA